MSHIDSQNLRSIRVTSELEDATEGHICEQILSNLQLELPIESKKQLTELCLLADQLNVHHSFSERALSAAILTHVEQMITTQNSVQKIELECEDIVKQLDELKSLANTFKNAARSKINGSRSHPKAVDEYIRSQKILLKKLTESNAKIPENITEKFIIRAEKEYEELLERERTLKDKLQSFSVLPPDLGKINKIINESKKQLKNLELSLNR
ncbi:hypothetical protein GJ496_003024 [Pomphorhynchus laevis]|nr:hypothetical protein GJ496_003024 [Pomphorhynchus laevis]